MSLIGAKNNVINSLDKRKIDASKFDTLKKKVKSMDKTSHNRELTERWDLILRYRMIEIIALWEGRLTTKHLQNAFDIGRSQASKVIKQYMTNVSSDNIYHDKHIKGYVPSETFKPKYTKGDINEYLNMLNTQSDLRTNFAGLALHSPNTEVINPLLRSVIPDKVRPIIQACRENQRIEIQYASLTSEKEFRVIAPHTLVFNGYRWHVRAYCEKSRQFRDFVLSRITDFYDFVGNNEVFSSEDKAWNTAVTIVLKPDTRLTVSQQSVIAADYGMTKNRLEIETRGAMVQYILQFLRVSTKAIDADPKAQQVVIENLEDVKKWLLG